MILHKYINDTLNEFDKLNKNDLFKIIIYLSKKNNNIEDIHLNINKEIDFKKNKSYVIIKKFLNDNIPLEYLTKLVNFCNIKYFIYYGVFIPRVETENIIFKIINDYKKINKINFLDLCSGSGCVTNSIKLNFPNWNVIGIEKYFMPYFISKINQKKNKINTIFLKKDIFNWIKKNKIKFDLVFCNPPYIDEKFKLPESVKKEPKKALFAKNNGLYYYEFIISNLKYLLKKDGLIIFEIGYDQKEKLIKIINDNNLKKYQFLKDQFNNERNLYIWR